MAKISKVEKGGKTKKKKKRTEKSRKVEGLVQDEQGRFAKGNASARPYYFKPGQSGNPGGRPKKSILDQALEDELAEIVKLAQKDEKGKKIRVQRARVIAREVLTQLMGGKKGIAQLVFERVGGKPLQQIEAKVEETYSDPIQRKARIKELLAKARINSLDE